MTRPVSGRKKKTTTVVEEPLSELEDNGGEPTTFDVALETVEDTEALQDVLSQFGETNIVLKILRQTPSGAEFCYQTDVLDEEFIQKNFGGGSYQVRVFIAGRYRKTIKIQIATRLSSNPNQPGQNVNGDRHSEFLEKMVLALVSRETPAPVIPSGPSITDLTTALANIDQLRGKQESGIEMFIKGMDMANGKESGGLDWKSALVQTAKEALPMFMNKQNPGGSSVVPVTPGQPPNQLQIEATLKQGITYLKKKAIAGTDPNLILDWICDNAEDEQYQLLIRTVLTTEFAEFAKLDPEIGTEPFFAWFKPLYDGIRLAFTPPDSVGDDTERNVGDVANVGSHGEPQPKGKSKP